MNTQKQKIMIFEGPPIGLPIGDPPGPDIGRATPPAVDPPVAVDPPAAVDPPTGKEKRKTKHTKRKRYNAGVLAVQNALHYHYGKECASNVLGYGKYPDGLDGILGSRTRTLIKKFKSDFDDEPERGEGWAKLAEYIREQEPNILTARCKEKEAPTASAARITGDPARRFGVSTAAAAPAAAAVAPITAAAPAMTRPEAINKARATLGVHWARAVATLAVKSVKYLIDKKGSSPSDAYEKVKGVFGLAGPGRKNSNYNKSGFRENLENLLDLTYSEINKLSESKQKSKFESIIFESTKTRNENLFKELIQNVIK